MDKNLHNLIKHCLETHNEARSVDNVKRVIWYVWVQHGFVENDAITKEQFMDAPSPESITRELRKVKDLYPELDDSKDKSAQLDMEYREHYRQ